MRRIIRENWLPVAVFVVWFLVGLTDNPYPFR